MGDTLTDANIDGEDLALVEEEEEEQEEEDVPSIEVVENSLILHENYSQSWHAPTDTELTDNAPQFSEYVLKLIGDLTNCRVEYEPDGKSVAVRGDDLFHIDQAMSKLYVMHDWAV